MNKPAAASALATRLLEMKERQMKAKEQYLKIEIHVKEASMCQDQS